MVFSQLYIRCYLNMAALFQSLSSIFFFLNDPAPTEIYPLSLHAALPISRPQSKPPAVGAGGLVIDGQRITDDEQRGSAAEWSVRHVHRRVHLTLGLSRGEAGPRLGAAAASDMPAAVLGLERFRSERDHFSGGGAREYDVHATRSRAGLQVGDDGVPVAGPRRGERGRVQDHEARRYVGQPAAPVDHQRVEPAGQLLGDGAALGGLDGAEVLIE